MKRQTPPSIHVNLSAELRNKLNAAARKRQVTASLLIRTVLAHYLAKGERVAEVFDGKLFE